MFFYKDLGKGNKDLLNEDYVLTQKFKVKTKTQDGVNWTTEGELSSKGTLGKLSLSFKHLSGIALDKLQIKTDGRVLAEGSLKVDDSIRFTVSAEDGRQEPGKPLHSHGKVGVEFMNELVSATAEVDIVNGPTLKASTLFGWRGGFVGAELNYNTHMEDREQKPEITDYNVGMGYKTREWEATVGSTEKFGVFGISYMQRVTPELDVGAMFKYKLTEDSQQLTVGGEYRPDPLTSVKAKLNTNALLSVSFAQRVSKIVRLTLCAEVDTQEWAADSHKFGLSVNLFD